MWGSICRADFRGGCRVGTVPGFLGRGAAANMPSWPRGSACISSATMTVPGRASLCRTPISRRRATWDWSRPSAWWRRTRGRVSGRRMLPASVALSPWDRLISTTNRRGWREFVWSSKACESCPSRRVELPCLLSLFLPCLHHHRFHVSKRLLCCFIPGLSVLNQLQPQQLLKRVFGWCLVPFHL